MPDKDELVTHPQWRQLRGDQRSFTCPELWIVACISVMFSVTVVIATSQKGTDCHGSTIKEDCFYQVFPSCNNTAKGKATLVTKGKLLSQAAGKEYMSRQLVKEGSNQISASLLHPFNHCIWLLFSGFNLHCHEYNSFCTLCLLLLATSNGI